MEVNVLELCLANSHDLLVDLLKKTIIFLISFNSLAKMLQLSCNLLRNRLQSALLLRSYLRQNFCDIILSYIAFILEKQCHMAYYPASCHQTSRARKRAADGVREKWQFMLNQSQNWLPQPLKMPTGWVPIPFM